jgi:hypothetical protein
MAILPADPITVHNTQCGKHTGADEPFYRQYIEKTAFS